jgi:N-acetylglutamate synthase
VSSPAVADIERLAYRAFPPKVEVRRGEWRLRATDDVPNRRINSATTPLTDCADLTADLDAIERFYSSRGADTIVRVLSPSPPEIDKAVGERGYASEATTLVMTCETSRGESGAAAVETSPPERWLAAKQAMTPMTGASVSAWLARLSRVDAAVGFALVEDGADVVSIGLGVVDDGWLGIFDVNTALSRRRAGHAAAITKALMSWGARKGARTAYLQVMDANAPALALYHSAGFSEAYTYWYRRTSPKR